MVIEPDEEREGGREGCKAKSEGEKGKEGKRARCREGGK